MEILRPRKEDLKDFDIANVERATYVRPKKPTLSRQNDFKTSQILNTC